MNAVELASFRALLQAQGASALPPDGDLFTRMRRRLTVVEGGMRSAAAASGVRPEDRPEGGAAAPGGRSAAASRVLSRVEAVLRAEAAGLEARRAALEPPP